ncbi:ThiF family adenylyltransferase [Rhizobium sp. CNPSo 3490]|uniref:ThiF family adenylyltransferase n=1 Tax=Rhizobium sp. CNPSo 3490 TaxID=3021407 RepID=UPI00254BE9B5|nr:ThiF family adenylyltransferase [Rhizobium sp. CNPSo 3490]MDK4732016.1 ThiF family adenylyltransferase [Rhizobium sp. CNPSo 3490]
MSIITADELHRTAKYFMDSGKAASHAEAMAILGSFSLSIRVSESLALSGLEQTALFTLVNLASRTFLGGVEVVDAPDCVATSPLYAGRNVREVVLELGGTHSIAGGERSSCPVVLIGDAVRSPNTAPQWRLTWSGWRGGVVMEGQKRLDERRAISLAPVLASAVCAAEAFAFFSKTHALAGRRSAGLSLWNPDADWCFEGDEPELAYLPASLWLIGLGNLGQAYAWAIASLDFDGAHKARLMLQDIDKIGVSNYSTSLLSFPNDVGARKTRVMARWLEERGFETMLEERLFGDWSRRTISEPGVALCGVDNAEARSALDKAGFGLVVEAGLGAGLDSFQSIAVHTFPASRSSGLIWGRQIGQSNPSFRDAPAYAALTKDGMDDCGLVHLATRTIAVPFVGLIAGCLAVSEVLRRLHSGRAVEVLSVSTLALADVETVWSTDAEPYAFGFVHCRRAAQGTR